MECACVWDVCACRESSEAVLSREDLDQFAEVWAQFDEEALGSIDKSLLPALLRALPEPMGFRADVRWFVQVFGHPVCVCCVPAPVYHLSPLHDLAVCH
jgi:hypothetical protein